jgi:predicted DNA-binding antitoxin AbrB/MazE fold protein
LLKTIKARYRNGVIEPLEEIDRADGTEINITIDSREPMSQEERERRFLSSAGRWKDIVDEAFLDEIYEQRKRRMRPEAEL